MTENLIDPQQSPPEEPELDQNKKYYEEYVGPGKKFSDNESLARGKAYSDAYVKILERRMDEMRTDYLQMRDENMAKAKLEELLDQIQKKQTSSNTNTQSERSQDKPELDLTKVESLISEKLRLAEVNKKESENFNLVKNKLKERFGTRYQDILSKQIDDLGLTVDEANAWAKKSPEAFFRMMKIEDLKQNTQNILPNSNVRSDSFKPQGEKVRRMSYYQELKKTNPKLYYDRNINIQMQKDAIEQGESFFDTD